MTNKHRQATSTGAGAAEELRSSAARSGSGWALRLRRYAELFAFVALSVSAIGLTTLGPGQVDEITTYDIAGHQFTANVVVQEEPTGVYVYLPVNAEIDAVVLETEDAATTKQLRDQLEQLDTFLPGEHVLELPTLTIHVIIDGIEER